ncbi:hypothetical protein FEM08_31120 [Flavobacterium gilvum]|nr:hypothetical protein FEM08_31120 [Flavobacterium gilvum]
MKIQRKKNEKKTDAFESKKEIEKRTETTSHSFRKDKFLNFYKVINYFFYNSKLPSY